MAKNLVINGVSYTDVPYVEIPLSGGSGNAKFVDTDSGDAATGEILSGRKAWVDGNEVTGSMANVGAQSGSISTKDGTVAPTQGYHNGSGAIGIAASEKAKLVSENIKAGVTVLGVAGKSTVVDTALSADAAGAGSIMSGKKAYVNGALITGSATVPTVSQDSATKVLSII